MDDVAGGRGRSLPQLVQAPNDILPVLLISNIGVREAADQEPLHLGIPVLCGRLQLVEQSQSRRRVGPGELLGPVDIRYRRYLRR